MTDRSLGSLLLVLGLLGAVAYVYWLFAPAAETEFLFYVPNLHMRWAIVIPVLVLVLALFFLAIWIGWTMVATPPPVVLPKKAPEEPEPK